MEERFVIKFDGIPPHLHAFVKGIVTDSLYRGRSEYKLRRWKGGVALYTPPAIVFMKLNIRKQVPEIRVSCKESWFAGSALINCNDIQIGQELKISLHPKLRRRMFGRGASWTVAARKELKKLVNEFRSDQSRFILNYIKDGKYRVRHRRYRMEGVVRIIKPDRICIEDATFRPHPSVPCWAEGAVRT